MHQILTLDTHGQPKKWSSLEDAVTFKVKGMVNWEIGDEVKLHGGFQRTTGQRSIVEVGSIISLKGASKHARLVPNLNNKNLFRRDLNICAYCGHLTHDSNLTRDHILPTSRGGKNTWTNCVSACRRCNLNKSDKTPEEAGLKLLYVPYTPSRAEELILMNRKILADQMEFLLGFIPETSRVHKLIKN
jgi:5-methylcytosine-specific restriction endonuclease McrA